MSIEDKDFPFVWIVFGPVNVSAIDQNSQSVTVSNLTLFPVSVLTFCPPCWLKLENLVSLMPHSKRFPSARVRPPGVQVSPKYAEMLTFVDQLFTGLLVFRATYPFQLHSGHNPSFCYKSNIITNP